MGSDDGTVSGVDDDRCAVSEIPESVTVRPYATTVCTNTAAGVGRPTGEPTTTRTDL